MPVDTTNQQQPHRPGPLHQTNKPHKGTSRGSRKASATSEIKTKIISKPNERLRREDRHNQIIQQRKLKREQVLESKRKLGVDTKAPLLIGLLDLHMNSCHSFVNGIKNYEDESALKAKISNSRYMYVVSNRLKMRYKLVTIDADKFDESLDTIKTLDILILLHSPVSLEAGDFTCHPLYKAMYIHCLPTLMHVLVANAGSDCNPKRMLNARKALKDVIKDDKFHCVEKPTDLLQLFNLAGNCKRQRSIFKSSRPLIDADKVELIDNTIAICGYVRHRLLSPNDLVHVVGFGDYQIKKIDILPDIVPLKPLSREGDQIIETLVPDPMRQETLEQENDMDPMEGEQTWPTAEELAAKAEEKNTRKIIKKLPPGTSEYQGAWIPEDSGDEYEQAESDFDEDEEENDADDAMQYDDASDIENMEDEQKAMSDDASDNQENGKHVRFADDDDNASVMDVDNYDRTHSREKELKILEKLKEARMNEMFPDEIDTPLDNPARMRFARYRGLKSFRTSPWDPQENLPPDYSRIFQFQNFQQTKRRVLNDRPTEGADPGQYVRIHLSNVPDEIISRIMSRPVLPAVVGLLKYERKMTVMNLLIKRHPDSNTRHPIKSKEELTFYVGFRKFKAKPLFSAHSISSKFKYERFLRDDVAMVATLYMPITFPPAPVLVFRQTPRGDKELVASGSVLDSNPGRLVIKRIRLSGHPYKIHSKTAVIRFMFFNSEDVMYFKPVEVQTKYSRRGHITEPLGTHGHMKCTFDRKIRSDDCVFMSLYKRVFPKWTYTPLYDV